MEENFSVYQWFLDGSYERVISECKAETAVSIFFRLCSSLGAKLGTTIKVIITDSGDCTCAEWTSKEGIIFPKIRMKARINKMLLVDQPRQHGSKVWCHLYATSEKELERMAEKLRLREPQHYQKIPHYDLNMHQRELALRYGAIEITQEGE